MVRWWCFSGCSGLGCVCVGLFWICLSMLGALGVYLVFADCVSWFDCWFACVINWCIYSGLLVTGCLLLFLWFALDVLFNS